MNTLTTDTASWPRRLVSAVVTGLVSGTTRAVLDWILSR